MHKNEIQWDDQQDNHIPVTCYTHTRPTQSAISTISLIQLKKDYLRAGIIVPVCYIMFVRMINDIEVHKIKPICYFTSYQKLSNNCKHSITILALYNHFIGSNHVQQDLVSNYYIYTYLYGIYTNYRPYVF